MLDAFIAIFNDTSRLRVESALHNIDASLLAINEKDFSCQLLSSNCKGILAPATLKEKETIKNIFNFKAKNPKRILVFYGDDISEENRLELLDFGADDAVPLAMVSTVIERLKPGKTAITPEADINMRIENGELPEVIQFLAMRNRSGMLLLSFNATNLSGRIYIQKTQIVHAEFNGLEGRQALAAMFCAGHGNATFHAGKTSSQTSINAPAASVLLEVSVIADTINNEQNSKQLVGGLS